MVDRETQDKVQPIHKRIGAHLEWSPVTNGRMPDWYGRLLSSLLIATEVEEVVYVTASYLSDQAGPDARVVVFTTNFVVVGEVAEVKDDKSPIDVRLRARNTLQSLAIDASTSIFDTEAFNEWPGDLRVALTYRDGLVLDLPLGRSNVAEYRGELRTLVRSLRYGTALS